jgi:signal peptidase I
MISNCALNKTDSNIVIRTKGDNNPASIPEIDYPISKHNYIGKVAYIIPKLGIIYVRFTYPPITFGIIAAVLIPSLYFEI